MYVPSPGTTFSVVPSSNVGATFSSIGTVIVLPFSFVVPALNTGVSDCF